VSTEGSPHTARIVVLGAAARCADVLEILRLAADVQNIEITPTPDGRMLVRADVLPDGAQEPSSDEEVAGGLGITPAALAALQAAPGTVSPAEPDSAAAE
jgi:hypothetical protein